MSAIRAWANAEFAEKVVAADARAVTVLFFADTEGDRDVLAAPQNVERRPDARAVVEVGRGQGIAS